jgi:hypothetical protein
MLGVMVVVLLFPLFLLVVVLPAFYANIYSTIASFRILSNSVFISNHTIRHYRAGYAGSKVK